MATDVGTQMAMLRDVGRARLDVKPIPGGFSLSVSGGGNITQHEYDEIAKFVDGRDGAEAFLTKVRARMAR